ncbi:MAG TPA: hypothetical protein VLL25_09920 [Acidimicrobiales bacterium]|nr:hypothetical protein [Acidimicrobiales bacterium]
MRKWLGALIVLAVLLVVGDVVALRYAQDQVRRRIDANVADAHATVHISGFPFLGKLAVAGTIGKITAHVDHASQGDVTFDAVDLTVTDVKLDRSQLFKDRRVQVQGIQSGTVKADMTQADFSRLLGGLPVTLGDGVVQVRVGQAMVDAHVTVAANQLHVTGAGLATTIPIPKLSVLPCVATVAAIPGHLVASCTFHEVPAALVQAAAVA